MNPWASRVIFRVMAAAATYGLLHCDSVVINELTADGEPVAQTAHGIAVPLWLHQRWPSLAPTHPVAMHMITSRDSSPALLSDFVSAAELHPTPLYQQILSPLQTEDQLCIAVNPGHDGVLGVTCNRPDRSFTEVDRALAAMLSIGLTPAYAAARWRETCHGDRQDLASEVGAAVLVDTGLTIRQAEVLSLLAEGRTYAQVGRHLGISMGTVRTHIQRLYRALGVSSAAEAVNVAHTLVLSAPRSPG